MSRGVSHGAFFSVRPIDLWPHKETRSRERGQFEASYTSTRALLYRECTQLGATSAVLQLACTEDDIRLDGELRANARVTHPGVIVSLVSRHGPLTFATDRFKHWDSNLRAIALGMEALRKVDRYGIAEGAQQYVGWKQLPAAPERSADPDRGRAWVDRLGSLASALRVTHPDHGGDPADFRDVVAYKELTA